MGKELPHVPTESELRILQVLWKYGPSSVRFVHEKLHNEKETGYTTTLKLMQIMAEKGIVERNTSARSHIYYPVLLQEATQKSLLKTFLDKTFQGSALNLVMHTLGDHKASKEELAEIKRLIEKLENQ